MNPTRTIPEAPAASCTDDAGCGLVLPPVAVPAAVMRPRGASPDRVRFKVTTIDCAVEESEIRRALAGITGIRSLSFNIGQRTLALDAPASAIEEALSAIRKSGFDPQPLADTPAASEPAGAAHASPHDDHQHTPGNGNFKRLGLALALAVAAEVMGFFAPDALVW